jgi:hypothetical protein
VYLSSAPLRIARCFYEINITSRSILCVWILYGPQEGWITIKEKKRRKKEMPVLLSNGGFPHSNFGPMTVSLSHLISLPPAKFSHEPLCLFYTFLTICHAQPVFTFGHCADYAVEKGYLNKSRKYEIFVTWQ